jgi:hypothetical protein
MPAIAAPAESPDEEHDQLARGDQQRAGKAGAPDEAPRAGFGLRQPGQAHRAQVQAFLLQGVEPVDARRHQLAHRPREQEGRDRRRDDESDRRADNAHDGCHRIRDRRFGVAVVQAQDPGRRRADRQQPDHRHRERLAAQLAGDRQPVARECQQRRGDGRASDDRQQVEPDREADRVGHGLAPLPPAHHRLPGLERGQPGNRLREGGDEDEVAEPLEPERAGREREVAEAQHRVDAARAHQPAGVGQGATDHGARLAQRAGDCKAAHETAHTSP